MVVIQHGKTISSSHLGDVQKKYQEMENAQSQQRWAEPEWNQRPNKVPISSHHQEKLGCESKTWPTVMAIYQLYNWL